MPHHSFMKMFPTIYHSQVLGLSNLAFLGGLGAEDCATATIEIGDTSNSGFSALTEISANSLVTVDGECYDQLASNSNASAGNINMAIYFDNGVGVPEDFQIDTGSVASDTSFTFQSVTETFFSGTENWFGFMQNNASNQLFFDTAGSGIRRRDLTFTYPTFEDPFNNNDGANQILNVKVGHT